MCVRYPVRLKITSWLTAPCSPIWLPIYVTTGTSSTWECGCRRLLHDSYPYINIKRATASTVNGPPIPQINKPLYPQPRSLHIPIHSQWASASIFSELPASTAVELQSLNHLHPMSINIQKSVNYLIPNLWTTKSTSIGKRHIRSHWATTSAAMSPYISRKLTTLFTCLDTGDQ